MRLKKILAGTLFVCGAQSAVADWNDGDRLHIRLIREAPHRAASTSRIDLMAHPLLRLARLKYRKASTEQRQVLRFLNAQCITQGFESEEDYFIGDLTLAQWARDARRWVGNMLKSEPEVCEGLFNEAGEKAFDRTRTFLPRAPGFRPCPC
jgi:hypothetical protein